MTYRFGLSRAYITKGTLRLLLFIFHHRQPTNQQAKKPRAIIFRVQHFQTKLQITRAIKARQTSRFDGTNSKYRIIPDISAQLRKKHDAFWPLREKLHELNITIKMRHPAVLLVMIVDEELKFSTVHEAKLEFGKRYPSISG